MKILVLFFSMLFSVLSVLGQELNCQVSIITDARMEITSVEQDIISQLENSIYEFMNNTKWTKDKFTVEERINCNIQVQINEIQSSGLISGSMQVQSSRPVFNSNYNSTMFNFQDDDISFSYTRNAALIYAPNQYRGNLTSILAFYAYFVIGMDYDSFSLKGGTKYFSEAQQIVINAQSSGAPGWKSNEKGRRNRYWLVDNVLHELFSPLRECNYHYHRKGLDALYDNKEAGRNEVTEAMKKLVRISSTRPNALNTLNFVRAKSDELKNLYADADARDKNTVVNLLKRIDPANSPKYQEILN